MPDHGARSAAKDIRNGIRQRMPDMRSADTAHASTSAIGIRHQPRMTPDGHAAPMPKLSIPDTELWKLLKEFGYRFTEREVLKALASASASAVVDDVILAAKDPLPLMDFFVSQVWFDPKDADIWHRRATLLMGGVLRMLCFYRDTIGIRLTLPDIRASLDFSRVLELLDGKRHPDLPHSTTSDIAAYLGLLPGYRAVDGISQTRAALDVHGFLEMQFTLIIGRMEDATLAPEDVPLMGNPDARQSPLLQESC